ncbi:Gfo/Idh/MocA family oxidoreductase [Alphaproteobacteria bacterium]|nr:Gfo/Idh/MocA family oxidoreductase [Alphaproteobacteria bacterium]
MTTSKTKLAVVGAGLIGRRHAELIKRSDCAELVAIVDPDEAATAYARSMNVVCFSALDQMLSAGLSEGILLATPNHLHLEQGVACVEAGIPLLIEKPMVTDVAGGRQLADACRAKSVPLLVGHHRRHNSLIQRAKEEIVNGTLGQLVSFHASFWLHKPDEYFDVDWRKKPGAGPVFINLIHDIDLMLHLCGRAESVFAYEANVARGFDVEDSTVVALKMENGSIGTITISDTIPSPWSWELTAKENAHYPPTGEACYKIGGTNGSLELPGLKLWHYEDKKSWWEPLSTKQLKHEFNDPLVMQIEHFTDVIKGQAEPLVTVNDGLEALKVLEAIKASAISGESVRIE